MKKLGVVLASLLIVAFLIGSISCSGEQTTPTVTPLLTPTPTHTLTPSPKPTPTPTPTPKPTLTNTPVSAIGSSIQNPVPMGQSLLTSEGLEITVTNLYTGSEAWNIIYEANQFNDPPSVGMQYVIITIRAINVSSGSNPYRFTNFGIELVGSSNTIFNTFDRPAVLPDEGSLSEFAGRLHHGEEETGSVNYYIPKNETNLVLVWDRGSSSSKRFFKVGY